MSRAIKCGVVNKIVILGLFVLICIRNKGLQFVIHQLVRFAVLLNAILYR